MTVCPGVAMTMATPGTNEIAISPPRIALGIIAPIFIAINSSNFQQLTAQTSRRFPTPS
jgi:hypothetical protein